MRLKSTVKRTLLILFLVSLSAGSAGDDKKDQEDSDSSGTPSAMGTLALGSNLNTTVPKDLAVTSVTATQSSDALQTGTIATGVSLQDPAPGGDSAAGDNFYDKRKKLLAILDATNLQACLAAIPKEDS